MYLLQKSQSSQLPASGDNNRDGHEDRMEVVVGADGDENAESGDNDGDEAVLWWWLVGTVTDKDGIVDRTGGEMVVV